MIIFITGQSGSGKTTLARQMKTANTILLDGDDMRSTISIGVGFSKQDRTLHNIKVARLAKLLESQGFDIIVSLICPYKELRDEVQEITNCSFIYLGGGKKHFDYPYEKETNKFYFIKDEQET